MLIVNAEIVDSSVMDSKSGSGPCGACLATSDASTRRGWRDEACLFEDDSGVGAL